MTTSRSSDVHLDEPWLSIHWDRERQCIYAEFKAFANSAEFRAGTTQILEAIKERHAASLVSDNRRLEGVTTQDQLWTPGFRWPWLPASSE